MMVLNAYRVIAAAVASLELAVNAQVWMGAVLLVALLSIMPFEREEPEP